MVHIFGEGGGCGDVSGSVSGRGVILSLQCWR